MKKKKQIVKKPKVAKVVRMRRIGIDGIEEKIKKGIMHEIKDMLIDLNQK